jgi:hypothetical protein
MVVLRRVRAGGWLHRCGTGLLLAWLPLGCAGESSSEQPSLPGDASGGASGAGTGAGDDGPSSPGGAAQGGSTSQDPDLCPFQPRAASAHRLARFNINPATVRNASDDLVIGWGTNGNSLQVATWLEGEGRFQIEQVSTQRTILPILGDILADGLAASKLVLGRFESPCRHAPPRRGGVHLR